MYGCNSSQLNPWWRHQMETFSRNWPFVRGIHRSHVNSPHKGQQRGTLMFSLICVWINDWVNNREAGDLRRCRAQYDVTANAEYEMALENIISFAYNLTNSFTLHFDSGERWLRGHNWLASGHFIPSPFKFALSAWSAWCSHQWSVSCI